MAINSPLRQSLPNSAFLRFHRLASQACSNAHHLHSASPSSSSSSSSKPSLEFPTGRSPGPFEIFHLPRSATTDQIKERYYQLVKLYHPDVASKNLDPHSRLSSHQQEIEITRRFKLVRDAYELLSCPAKRHRFLKFQQGWHGLRPQTPTRGWPANSAGSSSFHPSHEGFDRAHLSSLWQTLINRDPSGRSGFYSSSSYEDPFNYSHHQHPQTSSGYKTFRQQWERDGLFTKNGIFITSVGCFSLFLYLIQLWRVLPLVGSDDDDGRTDWGADGEHHERQKFRKFIEPEGDDRLDLEAWRKLKAIGFRPNGQIQLRERSPPPGEPLMMSSSLLKKADDDHHQLSEPSSSQNAHRRLMPKSFQDRIHQQNLKSAADLRSARAAAVEPRVFSTRISQPSTSSNTGALKSSSCSAPSHPS